MKLGVTTLALLLSATSAVARDVYIKTDRYNNKGTAELNACTRGITDFTFDYKSKSRSKGRGASRDVWCGYPPAIGTVLLCTTEISVDQSEAYKDVIFKAVANSCKSSSYHYDWEYYRDQYENATNYDIPLKSIANKSLPLYNPTHMNLKPLYGRYEGYRAFYFNLDSGTWFSVGICGYFLLLIVISALFNFARNIGFSKTANNSALSKALQKYVIFSPMAPNGKFAEPWGPEKWFPVLLPNRMQFIADVFLFALQVAFYCVSYRQDEGNLFKTPSMAWQRYVADRTGIMSFGKIPLLILFAGRNNFLLWVTGWSYSTCLHFHKILAWWMSLDAMIHSVAYTMYVTSYTRSLQSLYFQCGVAATVLCGVLLLFALPPIRKAYYEFFFATHVILAIGFIAMCWYHCRELGWMEWMIAACCVWFFDRLVRVIRMCAFGYRTAVLTVVGDDLFKVEVEKPFWWHHTPGTFSYMYFAGILFWESHPFTTVSEGDKLCAYIRVKKGVTLRVFNKLLKNKNQMTWKVCLEGPYGGEVPRALHKYEDTLLLAGGSGVPGIVEHAAKVNRGKLIWVAQTLQLVKAYKPLIANVKTDIEIYVTREQQADRTTSLAAFLNESDSDTSTDSNTDSSDKESETGLVKVHSSGNVKIIYSRPNIQDLIDANVRDSPCNSVGIVACGPPKMMDEIRNTITNNVTVWDKSVDYFDEFQIW
jgi:NAD(P)H-flavin reductase